jgi:hypothetical protein
MLSASFTTVPKRCGKAISDSALSRSWSGRSSPASPWFTYLTWYLEEMPRLETPIGRDVPIVDVRIWIGPEHEEALKVRGYQTPRPLSVSGLLDTGAQMTAIQQVLAQGMALPVHDWVGLRSSVLGAEERDAPIYLMRMTFGSIEDPNPPKWRIIRCVGVTLVSPGALVLIGQDLLATCRFTYDGRKRRLTMSY